MHLVKLVGMRDNESVKLFLENDLKDKLKKEIEAYVTLQKSDDYVAIDIITYNEIALLSLVKSALVRGKEPSEVWAMQEYQVYEGNNYIGRGDLFVMYSRGDQRCDLLIEAKRDGLFVPKSNSGDNEPEETQLYLDNTMEQALKYATAEAEYFKSPAYVITMVFTHMQETHYKSSSIASTPKKLYYEFGIAVGEQLLCVYGEIYKIK